MRHYLAACAVFKNEAPFLDEWLRFHGGVGIEHFYLYDNNSTDRFPPVLHPWVAAGRVTLHRYAEEGGQLRAYLRCLREHGADNRWLAFIDLDEFLFSPAAASLPEILAAFERYPAVAANWVMFGSNGHVERPTGLVTMNYTRRADFGFLVPHPSYLRPGGDSSRMEDYFFYSCHVKSIVDPARAVAPLSPHSFLYADNQPAVDEKGRPLPQSFRSAFSSEVSVKQLRINHYWSRSLADLREKTARGRVSGRRPYDPDWALGFEKWLNAVEDRTILPLARRILLPA